MHRLFMASQARRGRTKAVGAIVLVSIGMSLLQPPVAVFASKLDGFWEMKQVCSRLTHRFEVSPDIFDIGRDVWISNGTVGYFAATEKLPAGALIQVHGDFRDPAKAVVLARPILNKEKWYHLYVFRGAIRSEPFELTGTLWPERTGLSRLPRQCRLRFNRIYQTRDFAPPFTLSKVQS